MTRINPASMLRFVALLLLLAGLHACQLSKEEEVRNTLTFTALFDSLKVYDTVQIEVRTAEGEILDIIYRGRVDSVSELRGLEAPHWDGGRIKIVILGFKGSDAEPVLKVEKSYDGSSRRTEATVVLAHPDARLSASGREIRMTAGESIPLPAVEFHPSDLADRSLNWSSSNPSVAQPAESRLTALTAGSAVVTARMGYDTTRSLDFQVTVSADPGIAEIVSLDRDTLHLAENGAIDGFIVNVTPATASADLAWTVEDPGIAAHAQGDSFQGKKPGITKVRVASKTRPAVSDSAVIVVSGPIPVVSVRFKVRSIDLYVGGATRPLEIEVLPAKANQTVLLAVLDSSKATFEGSRLSPKSEGSTRVVVQSAENPLLSDTLAVTVLPQAVPVEAVDVAEKAVLLYRGGPGKTLTATVTPANAPPQVEWRSLTPSVATVSSLGEIRPVSAGLSLVLAVSAADSTKKDTVEVSVKVDAPVLSVGRDTVVSADQRVVFIVQAAQEYGEIVHFSWDLDGDGIPEDSSNGLVSPAFQYVVPKAYDAAFLVKDTEGNVVKATRRVTVVKSAAVVILEPADNTYTNKNIVKVRWSVDGVEQTAGLLDTMKKEGANTITRVGRDAVGKTFTASITVYFDTDPPLSPALFGTSPTNVQPAWNWKGGGGGNGIFRYKLGDSNFTDSHSASADTTYMLTTPPQAGTTYTLYVQERDAAGNWSQPASLAIHYDNTKPVVSIGSPQASGTFYTSLAAIALSGTATGPIKVASVKYSINGGNPIAASLGAAGAWSVASIDLTAEQNTAIIVSATDSVGNSGSASLTVIRDNTPPAAPKVGGATATRDRPTWTWKSGGGGAGEFRIRLGDGNFPSNSSTTRDTAWVLANSPIAGTTYTLFVQERDEAGNWSPSGSLAIRFDDGNPVLSIASPSPSGTIYTQGSTVTLTGTVRSPFRIMGVTYRVNVSAPAAATLTGSNWTTGAIALAEGLSTVIAVAAVDSLGATAATSLTVLRDNTAPSAPTFTSQPDDAVDAALAAWEWTATPDGSGSGPSGRYRYSLNGATFVEGTMTRAVNLSLREGRNEFRVQQQDRAGNWSASATHIVRLDTRGPAFAITQPVSTGNTHTETRGLTVTIAGTAVDTGSGVKEVACALSGKTNNSRILASLSGTNWTLSTQFASGQTQIVCTAVDNFNKSSQAAITVLVNLPKPTISNLSVRNGMVFNRNSFQLSYTASLDGQNRKENVMVSLTGAETQYTIRTTLKNVAGESGELVQTYYLRPNVVFVDLDAKGNDGKSMSAGDGSSWGDAYTYLHAALWSQKARGGNAQIWISRGTYDNTGVWEWHHLPKSGALVGGFNAADLPRDSSLSSRNLAVNRTVFLDYRLQLDTLDRAILLDGLELANTILQAPVVNNAGGSVNNRISLVNCTVLGINHIGDYWTIGRSGGYSITFQMVNSRVTNSHTTEDGFPGDQWSVAFQGPGTFYARNTQFRRPTPGIYPMIMTVNDVFDSQEYRWEDCVFAIDSGSDPYVFISVGNESADLYFVNTTIRGGMQSVNTTGRIH